MAKAAKPTEEEVTVHEQLIREEAAAWADYRDAALAGSSDRRGLFRCALKCTERLQEFETPERERAAA